MALKEFVVDEPNPKREPYFVTAIHFHEANGQLHDAIRARFQDRVWFRLRSHEFLTGYIRLGIKCASLTEAVEIANEYADGFDVITEIAVEGWETKSKAEAA